MEAIIIQNIIQSIPFGILVINSQGEIVICNPSASEIVGFARKEVLGKGWGDLFLHNKANGTFNQLLVDVIWQESQNLHRNVPYTRPNGEILQLSITSSFIKENDKVVGIVILFDDITAIHAMHLREKQWLEDKNRLEKEKVEGLFRLSLAVADQLRNPAVAIGGFARRILKQTGEGTAFCSHLHHIVAASQRLEDIVKIFTEYIDIPLVRSSFIPVGQLIDLIQAAINEIAPTGPNVALEIKAQPLALFVDSNLMKQALFEILKNAIEHGANRSLKLCINISQQNSYCVIEIADNGHGIPKEDIPFIFDPFFTTKALGIGIGLCKARKIITHLGGSLTIENMQHRGINAKITLPLS